MEASSRYPSVFVVDGSARDVPFVPPVPRSQKTRGHGQLLLWILVLLALAGLAVQAYFLVCFRKELDRTTTAQEAAKASHDRLIQGKLISVVGGFQGTPVSHLEAGIPHHTLRPLLGAPGRSGPVVCRARQPDHQPPAEKPRAHLTGASFTVTANSTLQWEHQYGLAFLQEMDYRAGSLICQTPGHYFIYSKVALEHTSCSSLPQKTRLVTHSVCKRTPRYPREIVLLTSVIPYCSTELWRRNSFLAGVVQLQEKEEVYVKVSESQLVRVKDGTRSYFGTFMI